MKILFVDPFCPHGHINLNRNYIEVFNSQGIDVDFIIKEGYEKDLSLAVERVKWRVPVKYYNERAGKFRARFNLLCILFQLRRKVNFKHYDHIFFSSYDEITLFLSGIQHNLLLVNHANIAYMDNPVKRFFVKKVSSRGVMLVYHEFILKRLNHYGVYNVKVESIGLSDPYIKQNHSESYLEKIDQRLVSDDFSNIIFAPSGTKYGDQFLADLIKDVSFQNFLSAKRILFVVKDKNLVSTHSHIVIVHQYITDVQYQALFLSSIGILLSYPETFKYRVSAVLFECFSNQKPCLLSDIKGFSAFSRFFNYNPFFKDAETLKTRILELIQVDNLKQPCYKHLDELNPKFEWLKD